MTDDITKHKDWQKFVKSIAALRATPDRLEWAKDAETLMRDIFAAGREAERERCKRIVEDKTYLPADCENLSMVDPETGVSECSATDCLCLERIECAEQIYAAIKNELPALAKTKLAGLVGLELKEPKL